MSKKRNLPTPEIKDISVAAGITWMCLDEKRVVRKWGQGKLLFRFQRTVSGVFAVDVKDSSAYGMEFFHRHSLTDGR